VTRVNAEIAHDILDIRAVITDLLLHHLKTPGT